MYARIPVKITAPCSVKVTDVVFCSPESVCLVVDDLGLVVETLNGAIVDGTWK